MKCNAWKASWIMWEKTLQPSANKRMNITCELVSLAGSLTTQGSLGLQGWEFAKWSNVAKAEKSRPARAEMSGQQLGLMGYAVLQAKSRSTAAALSHRWKGKGTNNNTLHTWHCEIYNTFMHMYSRIGNYVLLLLCYPSTILVCVYVVVCLCVCSQRLYKINSWPWFECLLGMREISLSASVHTYANA